MGRVFKETNYVLKETNYSLLFSNGTNQRRVNQFFQQIRINPLSTNPTKWSNSLKQFVGNLTTNSLSVFDHFVGLAVKELIKIT